MSTDGTFRERFLIPTVPTSTPLRRGYTGEVKEGRIEPRLGVVPVPIDQSTHKTQHGQAAGAHKQQAGRGAGAGNRERAFRLNMAGGIRRLERAIASVPVPGAGRTILGSTNQVPWAAGAPVCFGPHTWDQGRTGQTESGPGSRPIGATTCRAV